MKLLPYDFNIVYKPGNKFYWQKHCCDSIRKMRWDPRNFRNVQLITRCSNYYMYNNKSHYDDVTMSLMASKFTSLAIVYPTVYSGAEQREHQSFASLAFVRGIHRGPVNSPHKWPVTRKMFPFDYVIMIVGWPRSIKMLNLQLRPYWSMKDNLPIHDGLITRGNRIIIPEKSWEQRLYLRYMPDIFTGDPPHNRANLHTTEHRAAHNRALMPPF